MLLIRVFEEVQSKKNLRNKTIFEITKVGVPSGESYSS
jgi:hypothetical protein